MYKPGADEPYAGAVQVIEGDSFPTVGGTVRFGCCPHEKLWCLGLVGEFNLMPLALRHEAENADEYLEWVERQVASVEVDGAKLSTAHRKTNASRAFSWDQLGLTDMSKWPMPEGDKQNR